MSIKRWITNLFRGRADIADEIPEVVGHVTDADGQRVEVHRGPIRHDALTTDQLRRIARLRDVLQDAYPMTLDGWIDGFVRDAHPESEIRIIEALAVVFQEVTGTTDLSREEKQRLYSALCFMSAGGPSPEITDKIPEGSPTSYELFEMYRAAHLHQRRP